MWRTQTLSILTHTSKILTKIIFGRIEKKIDENLAEDQFGFQKNRGTREAILCFAKHYREKFCGEQKGIYCFCRLIESLWQCKLEHNDEDTKDDKNRLQR